MSDDNHAGGQAQPPAPAPGGFDWLIEAHQETTGSTSATDATEASAPPTLTFAAVPPVLPQPVAAQPPLAPQQPVAPQQFASPPVVAPPVSPPPGAQQYLAPSAPVPTLTTAQPQRPPEVTPPAYQVAPPPSVLEQPAPPLESPPVGPPAPSGFDALFTAPSLDGVPQAPFAGESAPRALALERHTHETKPTNGPLDWLALVLAIILPPIGLLTAIAAAVLGSRNRGFATSVAKAAIGVGAALTVVSIVAVVVGVNLANQQAKHDAIVASSVAYCAKLKSNPATLQSPTFGWPAPADTVPDSLATMQAYEANWVALEKIAPAGILAGTKQVASTAQAIVTSVQTSQVFDDSNDIAQISSAVSASGISAWATEYCN